jgi:Flp pilus assembly protein TadB
MLSKEICNRADHSEARNHDGFSQEGQVVKASTATRIYSGKAVAAAAGIGVFALFATVFYRVRELLAALILFSVVFGVVAIAFLILWLVERGAHEAAVRLETRMSHIPSRPVVAPAQAHANQIHQSTPWH